MKANEMFLLRSAKCSRALRAEVSSIRAINCTVHIQTLYTRCSYHTRESLSRHLLDCSKSGSKTRLGCTLEIASTILKALTKCQDSVVYKTVEIYLLIRCHLIKVNCSFASSLRLLLVLHFS